jgi:hypothetical protein
VVAVSSVDVDGDLVFSTQDYDSAAGRLLLFGTDAVRTWDGSNLQVLPAVNPEGTGAPLARRTPALAYDPLRGRSLLVGGNDLVGGELGDTWEFELASERPAEVCRFVLDASGLPPGVAPDRVRVAAQVGAGHTASAPGGASLQLWQQGRWQTAARCDAGACSLEEPAVLGVDLQGPPAQALFDDLGLLGLSAVPDSPNGPGSSLVQVRSAQVVVDYRLPPVP